MSADVDRPDRQSTWHPRHRPLKEWLTPLPDEDHRRRTPKARRIMVRRR